jgi:Immunoglobulin-like domain of bacterial spore germination
VFKEEAMTLSITVGTTRTVCLAALLATGAFAYAAPASALGGWVEGEETDACDNGDGAFDEAAFVIATEPEAGERVESGFEVEGCSRSFESSVQWKLIARDGAVLSSGNTQGGGVDGPGEFTFTVPYSVDAGQIGHLEVYAEDPSDGEGFPPGRTVLPLVLKP